MLSKEEIKNTMVELAQKGVRQRDIRLALIEKGYEVSRARIGQLMKQFGIAELQKEKNSEKRAKASIDKLIASAGTFKLEDVGCEKYHAARLKFRSKRNSALQTGKVFTLAFEDVVWPDVCPVLGITLSYVGDGQAENSVSFDQIDPGKGYVPGNVMIMSWRANRIKNDGNAEEHRRIAEFMELDFEEVFNGIEGRLVKQRQEERDNWSYYLGEEYRLGKERLTQTSFQYRNGYEHLCEESKERAQSAEREQQRVDKIMEQARQGVKQCTCCKKVLPRTEFHKHPGVDGLDNRCKQCKSPSKEVKQRIEK